LGIPTDTDAYPVFAGTTGKRDMLRALMLDKDSPGAMLDLIFRIANTPFSGCTDEDTVYDTLGTFDAV